MWIMGVSQNRIGNVNSNVHPTHLRWSPRGPPGDPTLHQTCLQCCYLNKERIPDDHCLVGRELRTLSISNQ